MPRTSTFLAALTAALAVAVPVAAAEGRPAVPPSPARAGAEPTAWYTALVARSEALNRKYGLGNSSRTPTAGEPAWLRALRLRSEALNRKYGLGNSSRTPTAGEPAWLRALRLRSEALNRKYGLDGGTGKAFAVPRHTDAGPLGLRMDETDDVCIA